MANFWIDTHAHIYKEEFQLDRFDTLARSTQAGVARIYLPNIDHTSIDEMMELEARNPTTCIPMMGLHPCSVKKDFEKELYQVEAWLAKRKFAAVGEIGTSHCNSLPRIFTGDDSAFGTITQWKTNGCLPLFFRID
jgi:TatD DNase family protein